MLRALLLAIAAVTLLGCPPNRGNLPEANEDGGSYGSAFINYRYFPPYEVYVGYLMIPRDDDYSCDNSNGYGWSDDDYDWLQVLFLKGDATEWEGDYVSFYSPECGVAETYDYLNAHCTSNVSGNDSEGDYVNAEDVTMEISSWNSSRIAGTIRIADGPSENFRATDCGELPAYYYGYDGRSESGEQPADLPPPQQPARPNWRLRFR